MSWVFVLQIIVGFCGSGDSVANKQCVHKRMDCVHRAAIREPKSDASDLIQACLNDEQSYAYPIKTGNSVSTGASTAK